MSTIYSGEHVPSGVAGGELLCLHCGGRYMPTFPSPIGMMIAIQKEFGKEHRLCKKSPRGEELQKKHTDDWWHWNRRKRATVKNGHVITHLVDNPESYVLSTCTFNADGTMVLDSDAVAFSDDLKQLQHRRIGERREPLPEDPDHVVEVWY